MGWIPSPHLAGDHPTYVHMYNKILSDHRRSSLWSASAVTILVAPNVDALCAARMLATLFKQDDVGYRIIPVSGRLELENVAVRLREKAELLNLILIDMGGTYDLPLSMWFGDFDLQVSVHVIDSARPQSLYNLFLGTPNGDRIIVWDDGTSETLMEEKKSWEIIEARLYEPMPDSDDEGLEEGLDREFEDDEAYTDSEEESVGDGSPASRKRRKGTTDSPHKRQRTQGGERKFSKEEWVLHRQRVDKYYMSGTSYGRSATGVIYILATQLERVDNDLLWLAILGLTYQYVNSRISRHTYEDYQAVYHDEISRLNSPPTQREGVHALPSIDPDDVSVRSTEELRFTHFRHWTLYDAMYHSSYVAGKLGIWKEKGRSRLTGLLAKMGLSITQAQQPYPHMDMDLKKTLIQKLDEMAPEYGLLELLYPSFMRCYGFHSQPLSAADAVEGLSALLDVAEGIRIEVEIEGMRNGGEWFGGGRVWEAYMSEKSNGIKKPDFDMPTKGNGNTAADAVNIKETQQEDGASSPEPDWWIKNFWTAYDALSDIHALRRSLSLSMSVHRAIIRTGTSIIDKQDIKTMRHTQVVVLSQGPDLALFVHPGMLTRLALWLADAMRDRIPEVKDASKRKQRSLPMLLACLNEPKNRFTVVGVTVSPDFGQMRRNNFAFAFSEAIEHCSIETQFGSFDASVVEIEKKDLKVFLETVCQL